MSEVCQTVKVGEACAFWKKTGCSYNGGSCKQVVEACEGCDRVRVYTAGSYCISVTEPFLKWKRGICNLATHAKKVNVVESGKMLNPLKASKRKAAGK